MRIRYILLVFVYSFWTYCFGQIRDAPATSVSTIANDTINLKKNYNLIFATTDNLRIWRLVGSGIDTILVSQHIKAPEYYFARLQSDFDDYFIMYQYPVYDTSVLVFKKLTGERIISGRLVESDKINNILYFIDWKGNFKLGLFDMNTMKIELFQPVQTACSFWWECIISKTLTERELTLEYAVLDMKREKKVYIR